MGFYSGVMGFFETSPRRPQYTGITYSYVYSYWTHLIDPAYCTICSSVRACCQDHQRTISPRIDP